LPAAEPTDLRTDHPASACRCVESNPVGEPIPLMRRYPSDGT
jgi:hypothetical protein